MTDSVTNTASTNMYGKTLPKPAEKGFLIGAGIGAVGQAAFSYSMLKSCPTKDEFIKKGVEEVKANCLARNISADKAIEMFKNSADENYKFICEKFASAKKQIPGTIGKSAAIVGVVGAAIGLVIGLVKNSKAEQQIQE